MKTDIQRTINEKIRPLLQDHGGDVQLVSIDEEAGKVTVRLQGACSTCPGAQLTLRAGVERLLREHVPAVKEVIAA
jgi:Fe-S cluster biogenesis protein NfuA